MATALISGSERTLTAGSRIVGRVARSKMIRVTVQVRPGKDPTNSGLKAFAANLVSKTVNDRQHLTRAQYAASFGLSSTDVQQVRKFARQYGLRVVQDRLAKKTNANQLGQRTVELTGKVGNFSRAFGVKLLRVRDAHAMYRTYQGSLSVPSDYQNVIENVFGLDTRPQVKPRFKPSRRRIGGNATHTSPGTFTPDQIAKLYNFPAATTGKGQTIALLEFGGGARRADLRRYFRQLGITAPKVKFVSVGQGRNRPTGNPNSSDGEVMLDVEVAGAVAPGANIVFYFAKNTNRDFFRAINAAIQDNVNQTTIISISWGGPEASWTASDMTSIDESLQAAASMGISVFVAAGDAGSTDGVSGNVAHVDFPASSPFATACGGTSLTQTGSTITESVWNDGPNNGTGGGVSDVFPVPQYQAGIDPVRLTSVNPGGRIGRGVPDVAGNADPNTGYSVRIDGVNTILGGTSAVAPLWAGLFARINEGLGQPVGFANTLLYSSTVAGGGAFRDITNGNNDTTGRVGGYSAVAGWDPCSGLGSPGNATQLMALIKTLA